MEIGGHSGWATAILAMCGKVVSFLFRRQRQSLPLVGPTVRRSGPLEKAETDVVASNDLDWLRVQCNRPPGW